MGTERKWDSSKGHERKLGLFAPTTLRFIPVVPLPVAARNTLFEGTMQDRWERDSKNRAQLAKLHETWSRSPENRERLRERSREWYKAPENRERFSQRQRCFGPEGYSDWPGAFGGLDDDESTSCLNRRLARFASVALSNSSSSSQFDRRLSL